LASRCLATVGRIHVQTHKLIGEEIIKYTVERGSGAMIYIPSFIKTSSGIPNLMGGGGIDRQRGDRISLLSFFLNEESKKVKGKVVPVLNLLSTTP
jgi:hypothetical protein